MAGRLRDGDRQTQTNNQCRKTEERHTLTEIDTSYIYLDLVYIYIYIYIYIEREREREREREIDR